MWIICIQYIFLDFVSTAFPLNLSSLICHLTKIEYNMSMNYAIIYFKHRRRLISSNTEFAMLLYLSLIITMMKIYSDSTLIITYFEDGIYHLSRNILQGLTSVLVR
jgi:hypothetical protein